MKKIDIHAHTSDHKLWGLHVESATISDLEKEAEKHEIEKIILMATYFPFKGTGLSNLDLYKRIENNPLFSMFGSLDVMNNLEAGTKELYDFALRRKIDGIKLYPGYQYFNCADPNLYPIYRLAEGLQIPVAFHTGELHHCCPYDERKEGKFRCGDFCWIDKLGHLSRPKSILPIIKMFPKVNFILCHLGNPYFAELREIMENHKNVYTDISGQFISGLAEEDNPEYRNVIDQELRKFLELKNGINRIMFGTDFPIQSYQASIEIVQSLNLRDYVLKKLFYENAAILLNL